MIVSQITLGDIISYGVALLIGFASGAFTMRIVSKRIVTQKNIRAKGDVIGGNKYGR